MQNNDKKYTIQQALLLFPPKNTEKTVDRKWRSRQEDDLQPFVMFRGWEQRGDAGCRAGGVQGSRGREGYQGTEAWRRLARKYCQKNKIYWKGAREIVCCCLVSFLAVVELKKGEGVGRREGRAEGEGGVPERGRGRHIRKELRRPCGEC